MGWIKILFNFFLMQKSQSGMENLAEINKIHFWDYLIKFYKKLYKIIFLFFINNDLNFFFNYIKITLLKLDFNF